MTTKLGRVPSLIQAVSSNLLGIMDTMLALLTSRKTSSVPEAPDADTMSVILDCFNSRIRRAGFYWAPENVCLPARETRLLRVVRRVCAEYEEAFRHKFSDIEHFEVKVDSTNAEAHFRECMARLFSGNVKQYSWGRIIGMMVYSSMLALQAMTLNKPHLVIEVVDWVAGYMNTTEIRDFMVQEGGWAGFKAKFDTPISKLNDMVNQPGLLGLTVAGAGICGAVIIAKLLNV